MRWALLILLAAGVASAMPQVEIKAQTQLQLTRVRLRDANIAEVAGMLVDRLTGDGLANQRVVIKIGEHTAEAYTKADGSFVTDIEVDGGSETVTLSFRGSGPIDPAQPVSVVTDPSRSPVALTISKVDDDKKGVHVVVRGLVEEQSTRLSVDIEVGPPGNDSKLTHVKRVDTNSNFLLTRSEVGGPGPHHIRATFAGDDARQPGVADATMELSAVSSTTLDGPASVAYEDDIVLTGKVTDDDGAGLPHTPLTLTSGDKRLAVGMTADDGTYKFKVEAEILGQGQYGMQVSAEPGATFIKGSKSKPLIIKIAAPEPVPVSYTIVAFIATAIAAGGFFVLRAKPWLRFRRPGPAANAPERDGGDAPLAGGLVANKPSIVSTLRRPSDDGFSGVVRDTVRGRPVPAIVRLVLADEEREVRTSADGSFAVERLGGGEWHAEVLSPGHITEKFIVSIPHRGELRDVRVDLVPVREKVFQLYRRAAEPSLPDGKLWGIWSPRQIVDHVRSKRPSPALAELTDFVEELYFSSRIAAETVIPHASERVDRAVRERARV